MNIVNFGAKLRTMTSHEIAELTGKQHKHVLEDVRKMLDELGLSSAGFSSQYKDSTGRTLPCFNLPKRETLILVSGYSIAMRARIVDRWEALETGKAVPSVSVPTNRASEDMVVLSALADALRLKGSARLGVMRKGLEIVAPHLLPALPIYAIDAPKTNNACKEWENLCLQVPYSRCQTK